MAGQGSAAEEELRKVLFQRDISDPGEDQREDYGQGVPWYIDRAMGHKRVHLFGIRDSESIQRDAVGVKEVRVLEGGRGGWEQLRGVGEVQVY